MAHWIRFKHQDYIGFGTLAKDRITVYSGDMYSNPRPTGETLNLEAVDMLTPCEPSVIIGLWNNLTAAAAKAGWARPTEPLYFFKPPSCFLNPTGTIARPKCHEGRILYEGELGVVIGRKGSDIQASEVDDYIFGYTCVNDVTAMQLIHEDESFPQWCRAKSFDTFGPFGPVIATEVNPDALVVKAILNGRIRQEYPVADMFFTPRELVYRVSRDMTLRPGDIIACGTSIGALPMKPGATIAIDIEGIGTLVNSVG